MLLTIKIIMNRIKAQTSSKFCIGHSFNIATLWFWTITEYSFEKLPKSLWFIISRICALPTKLTSLNVNLMERAVPSLLKTITTVQLP